MADKTKDALEVLKEAGDYWIVNYDLVHYFNSFEEAIILGYLCSMQNYWGSRNKLKEGKWFFCTKEDMRKYTLIEPRKQKTAIDHLVELGLVETTLKGKAPKTRHFHVNADKIQKLLIEGKRD